jgi:formyl-CoA transferase
MHERLNSYADFLDQPHVKEVGLFQWLGQAGLAAPVPVPALPGMTRQENGTLRGAAPVLGQHTRAILAGHGYNDGEIDALIKDGTVVAA